MSDKTKRMIMLAIAAIYIVSPIDAMPGPIDDALIALFTYLTNKSLSDRKNKKNKEV